MGWAEDEEDARFDDVVCTRETAKAILVLIHGEELWVPQSVVTDDSEVYDSLSNNRGRLVLKGWWARKNGLV